MLPLKSAVIIIQIVCIYNLHAENILQCNVVPKVFSDGPKKIVDSTKKNHVFD